MSAYHNYHFSMKRFSGEVSSKSTQMRRFNFDNEIRQFLEGTEFTDYGITNEGAVWAFTSTNTQTQIGWIK